MPRILVVDADSSRREEISATLAGRGYTVSEAECGLSALEALTLEEPDLLLCSESLPTLRTLELQQILRSEASLADLPVIIYGRSARRKAEAAKAGAADYFVYPFDIELLAGRLQALTKREASSFFHGELGVVSLPDVIQMLMAARCIGQLEITTQGGKAELFFRDGHIFCAKLNELAGEEAILTTLRFTKSGGDFAFTPQLPQPLPQPNVNRRTDHLLLHLANVLDEAVE